MRFLAGVVIGGAVGYVMGTKAGREQYERIVEAANELLGEESMASVRELLGSTIDAAGQALREIATD